MASTFEILSAGYSKLWACLSYLGLWRTAHKRNQSLTLESSEHDSPTTCSTLETDEMLASRDSQHPEPSRLTTLPTELILLIFEPLLIADTLCLALSCKRMYGVTNISYVAAQLRPDAKDSLLCRLERDTKGLTYCFRDQKLRPTKPRPSRSISPHHHLAGNTISHIGRVPWVSVSRLYLDFCDARRFTNHRLLGPQHGVPAYYSHTHGIFNIWASSWWPEEYREHEAWGANVIRGELFLSCTHTIFYEEAKTDVFKKHFCDEYGRRIPLCPHEGVGGIGGNGLLRDAIVKTEHYYVSGWCRKCETDWEVNIRWADRERGWVTTIRTYHGLGACHSPQDRKWQAMSISASAKAYREVPGGGVKKLWEQPGHSSVDQR